MNTAARLVAITFFVLSSPGVAFAQQTAEQRTERLEEVVRSLERRVAKLEDQLSSRSSLSSVPSDRVSWRKLEKGMSEGQVEQLLGSPARVDAFGPFTTWEYRQGGTVRFDGRTRTVYGWQEP